MWPKHKRMIDEKIILQVLAEQQEEIKGYKPQKWVARKEEALFEFETKMACKETETMSWLRRT